MKGKSDDLESAQLNHGLCTPTHREEHLSEVQRIQMIWRGHLESEG